ncbi:MAG: UDP-N-acetylglucosamine 1-carboxyvinyltransferase [Clostridia bacterium]|nr:UDP-N-acetylglucosamine 1-carboxyvinyltransferase [Clostridia bacterium]
MEKIVINGGQPLYGDIEVSGAKNAAVAVVFACLLVKEKVVLENIPPIVDVSVSLEILKSMGVKIRMLKKDTVEIDATEVQQGSSPAELVRRMRASYYLIGAELGRFGKASVDYPGGCDFGVRPIDQHIKAFTALGADVVVDNGRIEVSTENGIQGTEVFFDVVTVGATMNLMIAAACAEGTTIIENAAREPHVVDLANFLNSCGANIKGAGTGTIKINGVSELHGCTYAIIPDMIEAGTYMIAAAATGGRMKIKNIIPKHLESVTAKLKEMGVAVSEGDDYIIVGAVPELRRVNIRTLPYPGFPTDMQPQMCVLLCLANGVSLLNEGVWDSRFRYVEELKRMGANIKVDGKTAVVEGVGKLSPAKVRAVDLRAGAAMIIAGLATKGKTEIEDIHFIERGYDNVVGKLAAVGASIKKVVIPDENVFDLAN